MIRDVPDLSDEEYDKIVIPFDITIKSFARKNFLNEFIAFYIAESYKEKVLWTPIYSQLVNFALEELGQFRYKDSSFKKVKKILLEKYNLQIINEKPNELIEIKNIL